MNTNSSSLNRLKETHSLILNPLNSKSEETKNTNYDKIPSSNDFQITFKELLFGKNYIHYFNMLSKLSQDPFFVSYLESPSREKSFLLLKKSMKLMNLNYNDYIEDTRKFHTLIDALYVFDNSTGARFGVDFDLYLRTLLKFGTNKHLIFIKKVFNFTEIGCFALGELSHGSNIKDMLTTATYLPQTGEFEINSRHETGYKFWIGGAKEVANIAVVFARLVINEQDYGIHAFVVPLRNKHNHSVLPGIYIGDCGKKMGMNNKDEGFIIFRSVKIPRDNLLDRYTKISPKGEYSSNLKTIGDRFSFLIGAIMNEPRILVCHRTLLNLLSGLTITIRFAFFRRQFNHPNSTKKEEILIIEYPLTQYRLFPILSGCIIMKIAVKKLHDLYELAKNTDYNNPRVNELHSLISILKPITTWFARDGLSSCREICGGLGFSALNRIGPLYCDNNVNVIWEGDNFVLIQQTGRYLLEFARQIKGNPKKENISGILDFLQKDDDIDFKQKNSIIKNKKDFLNLSILEEIFEMRLRFLIKQSSKELGRNIDEMTNVFNAWNQSQVYYLRNMSLAYGDLFILKTNIQEINKSNYNKEAIKSLKVMLILWSLNRIYEYIGDFLGFFTKENVNDIKDLIVELCSSLKDKAMDIIESVCPPDEILNSPIGVKNKDIYNEFLLRVNKINPNF